MNAQLSGKAPKQPLVAALVENLSIVLPTAGLRRLFG